MLARLSASVIAHLLNESRNTWNFMAQIYRLAFSFSPLAMRSRFHRTAISRRFLCEVFGFSTYKHGTEWSLISRCSSVKLKNFWCRPVSNLQEAFVAIHGLLILFLIVWSDLHVIQRKQIDTWSIAPLISITQSQDFTQIFDSQEIV